MFDPVVVTPKLAGAAQGLLALHAATALLLACAAAAAVAGAWPDAPMLRAMLGACALWQGAALAVALHDHAAAPAPVRRRPR